VDALHGYAEDPDFAMKYLFYTDRRHAGDEIRENMEKDGLMEQYSEEWVNLDPDDFPLLDEVPDNPFLEDDEAEAEEEASAKAVGVSVIGQWGCSTSVFLQYILCLRLVAELPTIFVNDKDEFTLICEDGAYVISNTSKSFCRSLFQILPAKTWCLVDSNDVVPTVPSYLLSLNAFIVQAGKMNTASIEWLHTVGSQPSTRYYMKKWHAFELVAARMLHSQIEVSEKWLQSAANEYGLSAGMAFSSFARNERDLVAETKAAINCLRGPDDSKIMMMRATQHDFSHPAAYRLMSVMPDVNTHNRRNTYEANPPNKSVFFRIMDSHVFKTPQTMVLERLAGKLFSLDMDQ